MPSKCMFHSHMRTCIIFIYSIFYLLSVQRGSHKFLKSFWCGSVCNKSAIAFETAAWFLKMLNKSKQMSRAAKALRKKWNGWRISGLIAHLYVQLPFSTNTHRPQKAFKPEKVTVVKLLSRSYSSKKIFKSSFLPPLHVYIYMLWVQALTHFFRPKY